MNIYCLCDLIYTYLPKKIYCNGKVRTLFRKYAKRSGRMEEADGLLEKLRLYEGSYLKRAAALLFHPDPEKYVTGAFVKIGFFREGMDLVYQDEVHGNLFQQIVKLMDLLCTKYMKAA